MADAPPEADELPPRAVREVLLDRAPATTREVEDRIPALTPPVGRPADEPVETLPPPVSAELEALLLDVTVVEPEDPDVPPLVEPPEEDVLLCETWDDPPLPPRIRLLLSRKLRLPRSWGVSKDANRSAEVVPLTRSVRSTGPFQTVAVRIATGPPDAVVDAVSATGRRIHQAAPPSSVARTAANASRRKRRREGPGCTGAGTCTGDGRGAGSGAGLLLMGYCIQDLSYDAGGTRCPLGINVLMLAK
ncbi:MAG TPA: hypothetical protein VHN20_09590 [Beijerinckiaceae bacterium]|nr:hypothetical protein [Beijerinckiaceae bacterium]